MHRVWLNADDFGLTPGVSAGILRAMHAGGLTSTTALVAVPGSVDALAAAPDRTRGRIGLHLQLTQGRPMLPPARVPTLINAEGRFPARRSDLGDVEPLQILAEWKAQLQAFVAVRGPPSHLDSHHDVHTQPYGTGPLVYLATRTGLRVRGGHPAVAAWLRTQGVVCTAACETFGDRGPRTLSGLVDHLVALAEHAADGDVIELACHPAEADDALAELTQSPGDRATELDVLCDPRLVATLRAADLHLLDRPLGL